MSALSEVVAVAIGIGMGAGLSPLAVRLDGWSARFAAWRERRRDARVLAALDFPISLASSSQLSAFDAVTDELDWALLEVGPPPGWGCSDLDAGLMELLEQEQQAWWAAEADVEPWDSSDWLEDVPREGGAA